MQLKGFRQVSSTSVSLVWDDGHVSPIALRTLRDSCPCASCMGEQVLLHAYVPPPADTSVPGRYDLKGAAAIGNYALKFSWGDGHDLGIYSWEHLRALCECEECKMRREHG